MSDKIEIPVVEQQTSTTVETTTTKKSWKCYFAFLKDRNFWKVLALGQRKCFVTMTTNKY